MVGFRRLVLLLAAVGISVLSAGEAAMPKKLAYIVSDIRIPFWEIMARGIQNEARQLGYSVEVYSADNSPKRELEALAEVIGEGVEGIIVSPTTSSACATVLKLAEGAGIPVVIADIGSDGGRYVSYIASDNRDGAYRIGKILAERMKALGYASGRVGIVAIPQKRLNGQERTAGFMAAMEEAGIRSAGIRQQADFSEEETYRLSLELIDANDDLRALWLQGSNRYHGALRAIEERGKKGEILLLTFDAEPEFLELIPEGVIVAAAMQQPFLMGEASVRAMDRHLRGEAVVHHIKMRVLAVSAHNISEKLPLIRRNVLGMVRAADE